MDNLQFIIIIGQYSWNKLLTGLGVIRGGTTGGPCVELTATHFPKIWLLDNKNIKLN